MVLRVITKPQEERVPSVYWCCLLIWEYRELKPVRIMFIMRDPVIYKYHIVRTDCSLALSSADISKRRTNMVRISLISPTLMRKSFMFWMVAEIWAKRILSKTRLSKRTWGCSS